MMKNKIWLLVVVLIMLLVISACQAAETPAPAEEEQAPAAEAPAAEAPAEEEAMEEAPAEEEAMEEAPVSGEPIKMGFLAPTSSVAAQSAQDMIDGFSLFWEQHGLEVAGRPIEIFYEDSVGDPDSALAKARLMVEQRQVDMLFGLLFANEGLAVAEYVKETGTPTFFQVPSADDLTQRTPVPNVLRPAGWTSSGPHHPFGEWVAKNTDCRSVYTIGSDYAFGHEVVGGFVNTFTDNGGTVQEQVWNPIAEADFSSYLAAIQEAQPDCVFVLEVGASAVRFHQAWNDFGLAGEIPIYWGEVPTDVSILRGIDPPDIAVGDISVGHYAEGRDAPATQDFVKTYDERYGNIPSYYAVASYTVAQWIVEAIEAVNGDVSDTQAFLDAVKAVELDDSPMGPMKLDDLGNPIKNMYIRRVEMRDDGRIWNVVEEEIPNVSQFYHYDRDAFLAQPVYSRDYQGIDWP
jgi:branched-chain amino acid transport system substrate-binding protein